jgi:two-component system cell cycle sensor histidine kinase/response regulator CckA
MPNGGRLTLETEHVVINEEFVREHPWAKLGRYTLLTATDTGHGMPADVLDRVFEPFYTTKSSHQGSGLGLSVCRGIVEQHGGMSHGYSEPDVGTTFKVYLPVAERPATAVGTKVAGPVPRGNERILVADDEEQVRRVVQRVLEGAGYSVLAVSDGELALQASLVEDFDLAILDAVMPNMGGRATFDALRSHKPHIPVLFASGYGAEELSARFLSDIDAPMLPKPFDPDGLLRKVRSILDAKG